MALGQQVGTGFSFLVLTVSIGNSGFLLESAICLGSEIAMVFGTPSASNRQNRLPPSALLNDARFA
jgi:hypothetical protein